MSFPNATVRIALLTAFALAATTPAQADPPRRYVPAKRVLAAAEAKPKTDDAARCTGEAHFCAVHSRPFCNSQPGCAFSDALNLCTGAALKCALADSEAFCTKISGCTWR